jgi:hypothetical protein
MQPPLCAARPQALAYRTAAVRGRAQESTARGASIVQLNCRHKVERRSERLCVSCVQGWFQVRSQVFFLSGLRNRAFSEFWVPSRPKMAPAPSSRSKNGIIGMSGKEQIILQGKKFEFSIQKLSNFLGDR